MSMNNRKIAGFMSAESIYSLAFYIVMVAAIAGVGAGIMSKSASARGVSAVSILRANYQAQVAITGYGPAVPTGAELAKLSSGLLTPGAVAANNDATLTGVGTFTITNRTVAAPVAFSINVAGIANADVCKAVGSTGFGSWDALAKGTVASGAQPSAGALIASKGKLLTDCATATAAAPVTLTFISQ